MLYNPELWDRRSLDSFITWLKKQPGHVEYKYTDAENCLISQWLKGIGESRTNLGSLEVSLLFGGRGAHIVQSRPHTFEAALTRARVVRFWRKLYKELVYGPC